MVPSTDPFPIEFHTKYVVYINGKKENASIFFSSYLYRMFIEYSKEYTGSNVGVFDFLQIKSPFYNKEVPHGLVMIR